jgi:MFS family permease
MCWIHESSPEKFDWPRALLRQRLSTAHAPLRIELLRGAILSTLLLKAFAARYTMPISAVDSITLAVEHTKQQLFKPFRIGQWTKLAFVGLLAGELGANGCNRSNFILPRPPGSRPHPGIPGSLGIDPALLAALAALITAAIVTALAIGMIMMFVGSVMRFVLFDSIIARACRVRWSWSRRLGPGWRYFIWKLGYILVALVGIGVVVGIPVAVAFANGWIRQPKEHLPALVLGGFLVFLVFFIFAVITAVILVLTKDFVVPQMALENVDAMEGWRRLWPMMKAEQGAYAAYIGMKIVLAIVASIFIGIATAILGLMIAIPGIGLGVLAFLTGKAAGLTWNAPTITLAIVVGCILLAIFLYLVSLVSVPAIVFFPAYSMYFFAARYPRLAAVLYPASPAGQVAGGAAP